MQEHKLSVGWRVLQDVKDCGEQAGIYKTDWNPTRAPGQVISEWEAIDRLTHLQLLFAKQPYFGRELRSFNTSPWWYKNEFRVPDEIGDEAAVLRFEGVDYYCKVWLNGQLLGEHEGYFAPFEFEVGQILQRRAVNTLIVKVWSPWDHEITDFKVDDMPFRMTVHEMMKGTYEHSDGFIQRDVNPVGIWGDVSLQFYKTVRIADVPLIRAELAADRSIASISVSVAVSTQTDGSKISLRCSVFDGCTGTKTADTVGEHILRVGQFELECAVSIAQPKIWNTWDRGEPNLYTVKIGIWDGEDCLQECISRIGIRTAAVVRTPEETTFLLNGNKLYLRGTSYFPDVYVSKMTREQYRRDLTEMIRVGCNAVRVHVHVAKPAFYELCDELGIAVVQDSDLNWVCPPTEAFTDRAVKIFGDMVTNLRNHPSILCWVCMNEPDIWMLGIQMGMMKKVEPMPVSMMNERPGPQLVAAIKKLDPTRPYIKGSIQSFDPESGDLHNYFGSLIGEQTRYTDIYGMPEKLNTEFGFDAPAGTESLRKVPEIYDRLKTLIEAGKLEELQYYQYRLLKYFIEHYRMMKYRPNSGYFQFLFTDICPQSFYGVYDWWGVPKPGLKALEESNGPLGVFMEYKDSPVAICVVNDLLETFSGCSVEWTISNADGKLLNSGRKELDIPEDCAVRLCDFAFEVDAVESYRVCFELKDKSGKRIAWNVYDDAFHHPAHPKGHPGDMSHELGMRVFGT